MARALCIAQFYVFSSPQVTETKKNIPAVVSIHEYDTDICK